MWIGRSPEPEICVCIRTLDSPKCGPWRLGQLNVERSFLVITQWPPSERIVWVEACMALVLALQELWACTRFVC